MNSETNLTSHGNSAIAKAREPFVDFLRALGLLLLCGVHVCSPRWYAWGRSFDVPLMVVVSAICYNSLRGGGYLAYFVKRFKRIYTPVIVFLTTFFTLYTLWWWLHGSTLISPVQMAGSYLLLNAPSIGYVWIMRVFLLMAIAMPLLDRITRNLPFWGFMALSFGVICLQQCFVWGVYQIPVPVIRFGINVTLTYMIGYTPMALLGLRLKSMTRAQTVTYLLVAALCITGLLWQEGGVVDPGLYKYPPTSLYILYGVAAPALLWLLKPLFEKAGTWRPVIFLSENSMWVYLWHIMYVYLMLPWMGVPHFWLGRCVIVIGAAALTTVAYKRIVALLPERLPLGINRKWLM